MWYDSINDWVYWYGGEPYAENKANFPTVWGFPIENEGNFKWSFSGFTELCSSAYATTATAYYSLGGYTSYANDPAVTGIGGYRPAISRLVKYDFQNQTWSNSSTVGMAGYEEGLSVVGQGVFVPIFGKDGIIIFLGGDSPTSQDWKIASSLQPMSQITIFDVSSGQSYSQPATGTSIPVSRVSFCAVGVGASDSSTREIVATDLSFEWFKAPVEVTNRLDHQCEVIVSRQMLSIGGIIENNVTHKDPWANGLGIWDMTEVAWKTEYDPHAAPYTPSSIIKEHYQDSTKHYPKSWGNPTFEFIFRASRNISNMAPNNTASPKASPKDTLADPTKVPSAAN
ncbi:hypothetical protein HYFRA_00005879 [Hymenoscyphus fraxineus]|uniref:Kelch repeat protein n=1 Tax=Hymenoscyphus fraxineus TaxID=746836 RepID=A0A9N9PIC8_9HELO|nr:hypothetical protein HYFRA_00005879 [Hymenoscyphus fraxineus]